MFALCTFPTFASLDYFSFSSIFPQTQTMKERIENNFLLNTPRCAMGRTLQKKTNTRIRSYRSKNIKKLLAAGVLTIFAQQVSGHKTMSDACPVPLKIYPTQQQPAQNYFQKCILQSCNTYKCPEELPKDLTPIFEWTCPFLICVQDRSNTYNKTIISPKEQDVINKLALREKRCWQSTCHKFGKFFSPELSMPENPEKEEKLNQCFEPTCKLFSTHKCIGGRQGTGRYVPSNLSQLFHHMFQSICNTTLCPGRFVETKSLALREPVMSLVEKFLNYCREKFKKPA